MPKKYDLKLFPKVDAVVTISEECLEILKEEFPQFQDKFYCIENITSSAVIKARARSLFRKNIKGVKILYYQLDDCLSKRALIWLFLRQAN